MRLNESTRKSDDMHVVTSDLRRAAVDLTSLVGSHLVRAMMFLPVAAFVLAVASCTLIGNESEPVGEPTERSFDSLADYAEWCGKLRVDAVDYRTHGEMIDAIERGVDAYRLATPSAEIAEFHELRMVLSEMTAEMLSRYPREGDPYDTIHMADDGAANFAFLANRLIEVQRGIDPDIIDTLKAGDCVR